MRTYTKPEVLNKCRCPKPKASTLRKWNRVQRQYAAEMEQLLEQLWPTRYEVPELTQWDGSSLWDDMEMFGYEITDHQLESLTGFWRDPETGSTHSEYYVPSSKELVLETLWVSIDSPPTVDVAWDAAPVHSASLSVC